MDKVIYRTIEPCSMSRKSFNGWLKWLDANKGLRNELIETTGGYIIIQNRVY